LIRTKQEHLDRLKGNIMTSRHNHSHPVISDLRARIAHIERGNRETQPETNTPTILKIGIHVLDSHLPDGGLTLGALHEVTTPKPADTAAATSFCLSLLSSLLRSYKGMALWCHNINMLDAGEVYPPGLIHHGIAPERLVILKLKRDEDVLWSMEEALRSKGPVCVLGEVAYASLTATRRLQLAAQYADLPALILRPGWQGEQNSAASTRWRITTQKSRQLGLAKTLNEPGNPCWQAELYRCRRGAPGIWKVEWHNETGDLSLAASVIDRPSKPFNTDVAG
jgi:protein ImuA